MDLTLVPFGYEVSKDQLVDVQQVPSGKRCGCICPSCKAPLVARKGNKNVWHFAHDSKGELQNNLEKCNFSFYVSARMMARQLIGNRLSIDLPRLEVSLSEAVPFFTGRVEVTEVVTEARTVVLEDVSIDTSVGENRVDLCGFIGGYCLGFVFTHPGRDEVSHFEKLTDDKAGVVAISLSGLRARFHRPELSGSSYSEILADYITKDIFSKKWLYHPRFQGAEQQSKLRLERRLADVKASKLQVVSPLRQASPQRPLAPEKPMKFNCRLCKTSWTGGSLSHASCKSCGASPLLVARAEIRDVDK